MPAGVSLGMRPANERRRYNGTTSHWLGAYLDCSLVCMNDTEDCHHCRLPRAANFHLWSWRCSYCVILFAILPAIMTHRFADVICLNAICWSLENVDATVIWTIIGLSNGLSPVRCQTITQTSAVLWCAHGARGTHSFFFQEYVFLNLF